MAPSLREFLTLICMVFHFLKKRMTSQNLFGKIMKNWCLFLLALSQKPMKAVYQRQ